MNITEIFNKRYSTKVFDSSKKISNEDFLHLENAMRLSPSSVNLQPWHFIIATSQQAKEKIAKATQGDYASNESKILNASHVVALCVKTDLDETYLRKVLDQEDLDGRYPQNPDLKETVHSIRSMYVNLHKQKLNDVDQWMSKQVYINLGGLLVSAAVMGIDAVPIEGFDMKIFDSEFKLKDKGYTAVVLVALGYKDEDDLNAVTPKSRLQAQDIFTVF